MNTKQLKKWGEFVSKRLRFLPLLLLSISLAWFPSAAIGAEELTNDKCLSCHAEKNFQINRMGQTINISVEPELFKKSIHGSNACTTCHPDITSVPHKNTIYGAEQKEKINERCMTCHKDITKEYKESVHTGKASCSDCHGSHAIMKKEDAASLANRVNVSAVCMKCHDGEVKEAYMESFHGKANHLGSKKAASCADCHGAHNIQGPNEPTSMVSKAETPKTCAQCHLVARENFANGLEHTTLSNKPGSAPMYWTFKFFIWLTIIVITLLFVHMEMELYRIYKVNKGGR